MQEDPDFFTNELTRVMGPESVGGRMALLEDCVRWTTHRNMMDTSRTVLPANHEFNEVALKEFGAVVDALGHIDHPEIVVRMIGSVFKQEREYTVGSFFLALKGTPPTFDACVAEGQAHFAESESNKNGLFFRFFSDEIVQGRFGAALSNVLRVQDDFAPFKLRIERVSPGINVEDNLLFRVARVVFAIARRGTDGLTIPREGVGKEIVDAATLAGMCASIYSARETWKNVFRNTPVLQISRAIRNAPLHFRGFHGLVGEGNAVQLGDSHFVNLFFNGIQTCDITNGKPFCLRTVPFAEGNDYSREPLQNITGVGACISYSADGAVSIYLTGGCSRVEGHSWNTIYRLDFPDPNDTRRYSWTWLPGMDDRVQPAGTIYPRVPQPGGGHYRHDHACVMWDGKVFVIGGFVFDVYGPSRRKEVLRSDIMSFNPRALTREQFWTCHNDVMGIEREEAVHYGRWKVPRAGAATVLIDHFLYIIGGYDSYDRRSYAATVLRLDLRDGDVVNMTLDGTGSLLQRAYAGACMGEDASIIYVAGGESPTSLKSSSVLRLAVFNGDNRVVVTEMSPLPSPRSRCTLLRVVKDDLTVPYHLVIIAISAEIGASVLVLEGDRGVWGTGMDTHVEFPPTEVRSFDPVKVGEGVVQGFSRIRKIDGLNNVPMNQDLDGVHFRGNIANSAYIRDFIYYADPVSFEDVNFVASDEYVQEMLICAGAIGELISLMYEQCYRSLRERVVNALRTFQIARIYLGRESDSEMYTMQTGLYSGCDLTTKFYIENFFTLDIERKFSYLWTNQRDKYREIAQQLLDHAPDDYNRRMLTRVLHLLRDPWTGDQDEQWRGGMPDGLFTKIIKLVLLTILSPDRGNIRLVYRVRDERGRPQPVPYVHEPQGDSSLSHFDNTSSETKNNVLCVETFPVLMHMGTKQSITDSVNAIRFTIPSSGAGGGGRFGKTRRRKH